MKQTSQRAFSVFLVLICIGTAVAAQDTIRSRSLTVPCDLLVRLPLDDVFDIGWLRPGMFPLTGDGYDYRSFGRSDDVSYLDGIPLHSYLLGRTVSEPPLFTLDRVELLPSSADPRLAAAR